MYRQCNVWHSMTTYSVPGARILPTCSFPLVVALLSAFYSDRSENVVGVADAVQGRHVTVIWRYTRARQQHRTKNIKWCYTLFKSARGRRFDATVYVHSNPRLVAAHPRPGSESLLDIASWRSGKKRAGKKGGELSPRNDRQTWRTHGSAQNR